jgi:multiple sugar transport system substrate-binding protein
MKKLFVLVAVLFLTMSLSVFAQSSRPKLSMWIDHFFFSPATDAMFKSQALEFAQQAGFDLEWVQDSPDVMLPRENTALESRTLPDVLYSDVSSYVKVRRAGQALDVTDVVGELNKNMGGYTPGILAAVTSEGRQYAVPYAISTEEFYVRSDMMAKAGLAYPLTWDDAFALARKVHNPPSIWGMALQLGNNYDTENQVNCLLWAYGASVFAKDGKTIALDSPQTRQVLALLKKAWDDGLVAKDVLTGDESWNNKQYQAGKAAMIQNTGSVAKWAKENDPDLLKNTALGAPPAGPKGRFICASGYTMTVASYSKNVALAKGLVKYLSSPAKYQAELNEMQGFRIPAYAGLGDLKMWQDPLMKPLQANIPYTFLPGYPGPVTDVALQAYNQKTLALMVGHMLADNWSADQAIADAVAKLQKIVALSK